MQVRLVSARYNLVHDCDEVFNFWEPLHYLLYGYGKQTWEYRYRFPAHWPRGGARRVRRALGASSERGADDGHAGVLGCSPTYALRSWSYVLLHWVRNRRPHMWT